jgi:hypothetical protein
MGNTQGINMCCNSAYINKNHELITPENSNLNRVKIQSKNEDKENMQPNAHGPNRNIYEGEMHITDR